MWTRVRSALRNLLRKQQIESDLDAEIRSYVDAATDEKIASGLSRDEARRRALAESGGMEQVKQALDELSVNQRKICLMRFFEGMDLEEISQATGMPVNTVKTHLHRGISAIRARLGGAR